MLRTSIAASLITALFLIGCSGDTNDPSTTGAGASSSASAGSSTSGSSSSASSGSGGGDGPSDVVLNEAAAAPKATLFGDWAELYNKSDKTFDLSGYGLADSDNATLGPKLGGSELRFPDGTKLEPGAYLLVVADQAKDSGAGPFTECGGLAASCYYASWGASDDGETFFLVDTSDQIVTRVEYPALSEHMGQSWGRIPDGTGEFAFNTPTPGATNKPAP